MLINTKNILRESGWETDRKINIDKEIVFLNEKGYKIIESFVKFYQNLGRINFLIQVKGNDRFINFDIFKPVSYDYDSVIIEDYPKITGSDYLVPIGNIDGSSYLVIDEKENVYSLYDGYTLVIGNNIEEALDNLCNKGWRELEELPIPNWWGE